MLTKNIMQRCYKFKNIKNHPWFANFILENLISMSLEVPVKPKLESVDVGKRMSFKKYVKVRIMI